MGNKPVILLIDHNARNLALLAKLLTENGYGVVCASTLEEVDRVLYGESPIRLALVDIGGFGREIWDRCEDMRDRGIPFLVIYPQQHMTMQEQSKAHGARGVLVKPLARRELLVLLQGLIGEEQS